MKVLDAEFITIAIEVIRMVGIPLKPKRISINSWWALSTNRLVFWVASVPQLSSTFFANRFSINFCKSNIRHRFITPANSCKKEHEIWIRIFLKICLKKPVTCETLRMPTSRQCLYNSTNNKLWALCTAGCIQHLKIMSAIFSSFKLKKFSILKISLNLHWDLTRKYDYLKWLKALSTNKTLRMIQVSIGIDQLFILL